MDKETKSAIDSVLIACDRGNSARDEWRRWRTENPRRSITKCFDWILNGELRNYNDSLVADEQIKADVKNPASAFFADSMDMYTLDTTIIGSALTQLIDEGAVDESARPFVDIALKRQSHPDVRVHSEETLDLIRNAFVYRIRDNAMQFQVVFQFPEDFFETRSDLVAFEDKLIASMPRTCDVDGYDIGSGTANFYVYTNSPLAALKHFNKYLGTNKVKKKLRVSYRNVGGDAYTNLWPFRDPRPFGITYPDGIDPFSAKSKRLIPKRSPQGVSKYETPAADQW